MGSVEVEEPQVRGDVVEISLELPAGEVFGKVVDRNGKPVEGARVTGLFFGDGRYGFSGTSDSNGDFEAKALAPGRYRFIAGLGLGQTSGEEVSLSEGGSPIEVRLVMDTKVVRGRITSAYGPVVGAGLESVPVSADGGFLPSSNPSLRSDSQGSFEIGIPSEAPELATVVFAEGFAVRALRLAPSQEELMIEVDGVGGTLVLELPPGARRDELFGASLHWNGSLVFLPILKQRWANLHGGSEQWPASLTLPHMEPATYELCSSGWRDGKSVERTCVGGVLMPNAELRLSLAEGRS